MFRYKNFVGIAFVDQFLDRRYNPQKYKDYEKYLSTLDIFTQFQLWCIDAYVGKQRFSHVELALPLPDTSHEVLVYGVNQTDGVFCAQREFKNKSYKWITLAISDEQYDKIRSFCDRQLGKKWSSESARWSVLFPVVNKRLNGNWWCSSFVIAALKQVGYIKYYNPFAMDIDDLYRLLERHPERSRTKITPEFARDIDMFFHTL